MHLIMQGSVRMLSAIVLGGATLAIAAAPQEQPRVEQVATRVEEMPWPMRLGARVAALEQRLPVRETVVLVPDEATFVAEIARWSPAARWPVLIEDESLAPRFIERFAPRRVFRRASVGALPDDPAARQRLANEATIRAFGGDPARQTLGEVFTAANFTPPGVVLTEFADPAWLAATALAAGRGQPLAALPGEFGGISTTLDAAGLDRLRAAVDAAVAASGHRLASGDGEGLRAITLCRTLPVKASASLPEGRRVSVPVPNLDANAELAVSDLLGRDADGVRVAIVSHLFGDAAATVHAAMSALFLDRREIWLVNSYQTEGDWAFYGLAGLDEVMGQLGWSSRSVEDPTAGIAAEWLAFNKGATPDVLFLNSSGNPDRMSLGGERTGWVKDIPILDRPLALHFIHSFSLARPDDPATLGGAWLREGVYAYAGAVGEPFLASFVPPRFVLERLANLVPFLAAARQYEGPFAPPWRVMTFGDPLMLAAPPQRHRLPRTTPPAAELVPGETLADAARESMRRVAEDPSAANHRAAIRDLVLLGRGGIAVQVWRNAVALGLGPRLAAEIQPVLFRERDLPGFVEAWTLDPAPSERSRQMLWQLALPRLGAIDDRDTLMLLQTNLRAPQRAADLERLLPALQRVLGAGIARRIVQRELDAAPADEKPAFQRLIATLPAVR
jgi:hypothetical protein